MSATSANSWTGGIIGFYTAIVKDSAWHFVLVPTEKPTITYDNTTNEVTMVSATTGATIYYTTDGSEPDKDHVGGSNPTKQYDPDSKPIISTPTTIKAIAVADNYDVSEVRSLSIQKVETPIKSISATGMIELSSATPSSVIYYTIGDTEPEDPTASSTLYTDPLDNAIGKYIKAIGVKEGWINSDILSTGLIQLQCTTPVITRVGMTFTISCVMPADAIIYYSINGGSETLYSGPVAFTNDQLPITVTAVAKHSGYTDSEEASITLRNGSGTPEDPYLISGDLDFSSFITDVNNGTAADKCFKLISDISASGVAEITTNFTGSFDGGGYTISGLSHPLFNTVDGGVVKNVMLKDVQISGSGNVGAIAGEASGYTRIYNCGILPSDNKYENESSYVSSSDGNCGGLVGLLNDDSRVINCFSYANITGGTTVAGIVGYNGFASTTKVTDGKYTQLKTAIVNCMFYGNITGGTTRYPVYGGNKILNNTATGINNYDFYRAEANLGLADNSHYNCSWPAKEEYLTKYEYYRYLLNSNRELCGWWVGAPSAPSGMLIADVQAVEKDASLMAKWVLDPSIAPYPILKAPGKYYSAINQDPDNRINPISKAWESRQTSENTITTKAAPDTEGQKLGSITVTINKGGSLSGSSSKNITITAMDIENNDFCYGKIQLPYYNSIFGDPNSNDWATRYGGNYGDKVVVGWEITSVTGGTEGTLVKNWQDGYNFADRDCTNKDKERIFAQGGYYYVPNGVSAITITAKWADATYLDNNDNYYDRISKSSTIDVAKGTQKSTFYPFEPAGKRSTTLGNGKNVKTGAISSNLQTGSVYEKAIVLVGNNQNFTGNANYGASSNGFTVMSADFDLDNEPDYSLIWQLGNQTSRFNICPIRFDFLPVIEIGMAMKEDASTQYYSLGCYLPLGHFEVTETSLIHFGQFEFGNAARTKDAPLILNGGIFDQYCKGTKAKTNADDHIDYVILGGNVYMPSFSPGAHVNSGAKFPTRHCAVNVLGGRINNLYLTGNFNNEITPNTDNPHCYIDGGNFKQIAAAAKEGINGDVYFKINHSIINEFYGGSTLADKLVTGSIDVTVDNSKITKYCGGPKFGNMASGKTVTTNATGTTFGVYYGGGNGGTSYVQYASTDKTVEDATGSYNWDDSSWGNLTSYTPNTYRSGGKNYIADYEMEIVNSSAGTDAKKGIFRTYFYAAQFSATNTGPITNNLTNCKVLTSFYGGGNLGGVIGDVESTLTDTEVMGSAFGAGYSASVPEVTIYNKDKTAPTLNVYTGIITPTPDPDPNSTSTTYTWCYKNKTTNVVIPSGVVIPDDVGTGKPTFEYGGKKYFYTEESLENLGTVTGKATLTINGTTVAESVYGGGEESGVGGDTEVTVTSGTIGTTDKGGATWGNVYGGGKGKNDDANAGLVKGNTNITISGTTETTKIIHNVYGGGAYGSVGTFTYDGTTGFPNSLTANTGTTNITITGGTFGSDGKENGMIFGSSRGSEGDPASDANVDKIAWVGNTNVVIGTTTAESNANPAIKGSVYGGGENGHNYQNGHVTVHSGTIGITDPETDGGARYPTRGNVYGGGCGTDTFERGEGDDKKTYYDFNAGIVLGNTTVDIDGGHIVHNVYGGGAMGSVGTYTFADAAYNTEHPEVPVGMPISCAANTGLCTINITGGKIGMTNATMTGHGTDGPDDFGHVFGAGRGYSKDPDLYPNIELCAFFNNTALNISGSAFICGSVYGGSESGHVLHNTSVNMSGGQIGCAIDRNTPYTDNDFVNQATLYGTAHWTYTAGGMGAPYDQYADTPGYDAKGGATTGTDGRTFYGNVFAGGSGYYPYAPGKWLRSAGHIGGTASVTLSGGHILNNLYGGCEMADIDGAVTVTMTGGTVGVPRHHEMIAGNPNYGNVYGAGMGDKRIFFNTSTNVASTTINISNGTVYGSVYGGGEDGHVMGSATTTISQPEDNKTVIGCNGQSGYDGNVFGAGQGHVGALTAGVVGGNASLTITGGTLNGSAYGGGRIASVGTYFAVADDPKYGKMQDGDDHGNLSVSLTGGTISQNVYGGCMGTAGDVAYGVSKNVSVELNNGVDDAAKGCVVLGPIFGCNNVNSSPEGTSTVHIYKTQRNGASRITNTAEVTDAKVIGTKDSEGEFNLSSFDVPAVYGGGNLAAYTPKAENGSTNVIIDGCERTSIGQVYGGGNAASTPATSVTVNGTFEIGELFGGGNGKDAIAPGVPNPGANVGFYTYDDDADDAQTPEDRAANYGYGSGQASVNIYGGTIHRVFGGSNTKGNVRKTAVTMLEEVTDGGLPVCEFHVDEAYGGGKSALMDAQAKLLMACIPGLAEVYGGAQAADIHDDVTLTITNGTFNRVFGGNNLSGTIDGSITVNVEEVGCRPIIIGELYGGGNLAAYSIYGYNDDDTPKTSGENPSKDPEINVKSFTSIGSIYGGGYGEPALMVGSPTVNINEVADPESEAQNKSYTEDAQTKYYSDYAGETKTIAGHSVILPSHAKGKMGSIYNVFGGGNAAMVKGNTTVNIGTTVGDDIYMEIPVKVGDTLPADCYTKSGNVYTPASGEAAADTDYYKKYTVLGVDIRDNVYGGGNNAEVTGNANVNIGKKVTP